MTVNPFITGPNELSFSGLIDTVLVLTGGVGKAAKFVAYGNNCIRDAQIYSANFRDLVEVQVPVTMTPMVWALPPFFRVMSAVKYKEQDITPSFAPPGRVQTGKRHIYYAVDDSLVFGGIGIGETINIAYYRWRQPLAYFPKPSVLSVLKAQDFVQAGQVARPAYYDTDTQTWMYLQADGTNYGPELADAAAMELARTVSANWVVINWPTFLISGIMSMEYTARGDTAKSAPYYSQYQKALTSLKNGSDYEALDL